MSQRPVSTRIERTCEGCGTAKEFEMVGISRETVEEMAGWYTVIREVFDPEELTFHKLMVQACSLACVPAAAVKLALPPTPPDDHPFRKKSGHVVALRHS